MVSPAPVSPPLPPKNEKIVFFALENTPFKCHIKGEPENIEERNGK